MNEKLDEQSRKALVQYRLERADETITESEILSREAHYNAAVNRLYYACFYATSALLVANLKYAIVGIMTTLSIVTKKFVRLQCCSSNSQRQDD